MVNENEQQKHQSTEKRRRVLLTVFAVACVIIGGLFFLLRQSPEETGIKHDQNAYPAPTWSLMLSLLSPDQIIFLMIVVIGVCVASIPLFVYWCKRVFKK